MSRPNATAISIFILAALATGLVLIEVAKAQVSPETIEGFELGAGVDHPSVVPLGQPGAGQGQPGVGLGQPGAGTGQPGTARDVPGYLTNLYRWFLGFVGIAALLGIVIGGVMYMFAGANITQVGEAQKWIKNAIAGILIAAFSYLLLRTINPDLIQGFNIQTVIDNAIQSTKK